MKKFLEKNLKEAIPFYLYNKFVKLDNVETSYFEIADVGITEKTDYKKMLKDQFPFLKGKEYKLICDKLDEAKAKAIDANFLSYYSAYAAFVFNKLRAISNAIYDKSNSCENIYEVLKDYKMLDYISNYFYLIKDVKDTPEFEVEKEYTDEAANIHNKKAKSFSIMIWILSFITALIILVTCFVFTKSAFNFIIPIVPICIACFAIFVGFKNKNKLKAECNYIPGTKNTMTHITKTNKVCQMFDSTIKDIKILSSEEFCEIVTNEKEINLHLLDAIIYIVYTIADENSKEEIKDIIYGDAFVEEIEKEYWDFKDKLESDFNSIPSKGRKRNTLLDQLDAAFVKRNFNKAYAKTICLFLISFILLIGANIFML
ncbi:MAG: hypothetical protein MJ244_03455 [Clostridia bacterium]|nr:hypothetical protein [Clostridia bacterium]